VGACRSMYALLMLLPQSEAFKTLHARLHSVPTVTLLKMDSQPPPQVASARESSGLQRSQEPPDSRCPLPCSAASNPQQIALTGEPGRQWTCPPAVLVCGLGFLTFRLSLMGLLSTVQGKGGYERDLEADLVCQQCWLKLKQCQWWCGDTIWRASGSIQEATAGPCSA
jgi:hypothetical protein